MRIACHQTAPVHGNIEANLEQMRRMIEGSTSDLHVFPELGLTGYCFGSVDEIRPLAQPLSGSAVEAIGQIAIANEIAICTGFMEKDDDKFYNSSILIDRKGNLIGHYRKVHLFDREKLLFERGNLGFPVCDLGCADASMAVGMMICYDWRFPEAARTLALHGAQVICVPSNIVTTSGMLLTTLRTRAFENKVILAFADRVGEESCTVDGQKSSLKFRGSSAIIGQNGYVLAELDGSSIGSIASEIDPDATINKSINSRNHLFDDRHRESYH